MLAANPFVECETRVIPSYPLSASVVCQRPPILPSLPYLHTAKTIPWKREVRSFTCNRVDDTKSQLFWQSILD
jgi:hypothetical protein